MRFFNFLILFENNLTLLKIVCLFDPTSTAVIVIHNIVKFCFKDRISSYMGAANARITFHHLKDYGTVAPKNGSNQNKMFNRILAIQNTH